MWGITFWVASYIKYYIGALNCVFINHELQLSILKVSSNGTDVNGWSYKQVALSVNLQ
jgi:hypothetical protein